MARPGLAFLFVCAVAATGCANAAQPAALATPQEIQRSIDAYVANLPGAAVVVGTFDRGRVATYAAGRRGVDEDGVFQIGSITKAFTATLLAAMVEDGEVRLDDPIQKYLPPGVTAPSFHGRQITLLNLAEQNSGLPRMPSNFHAADPLDPYASYTPAMLAAFLSHARLTRAPGAQYEYSNLGVGLLGDLLARRAGMPYAQLLARRVLEPLHLNDTAMTPTASMLHRLLPGYDSSGSPAPVWTFADLGAAGGLYSTLRDMMAFLRANLAAPQGTLGPAMAMAQTPRAADDSPGGVTRVGLVWETNVYNGNTFKNGEVGGYHALIVFNRARQTGVVILASVADGSVDLLGLHVFAPDLVAAPPPPAGSSATAAPEDPAVAARAKAWFHRLQTGNVDPAELTPDFAAMLTPAFVRQVQTSLQGQGEPSGWTYLRSQDRGGVVVYTYRIVLNGQPHEWSIALTADGKIAGSLLK